MAVLQADFLRSHDCRTASAATRSQEGCDAPKPKETRWVFDGIEFDRCPAYYIERARGWIDEALELFHWAQKGILPKPGSWLDQPAKWLEIIRFIEYLISKRAPKNDAGTVS